ncbi:MAG: hypothetical protein AAGB00_06920 [Planctomycetota bacterium]
MSHRPIAAERGARTSTTWFPLAVATLLLLVAAVARGAELYDLTPAADLNGSERVTVEIEFGGELLAKDLQQQAGMTAAEEPAESAPRRAPMKVEATLAFDEQRVSEQRSVRYYRRAEATIQAGAGRRLPALPTGRRLILATRASTPAGAKLTLTSPDGPLNREQLELIDVISDATAIDRLLPGEALEKGGEWPVDKPTMAALLGLDTVAVSEVRCILDDGNKRYARFQMAGSVHGALDGAATEFNIRAIGLFSRRQRRVTQLNLAMTEKREVGPARPGVEGTAKIKIKRAPIATPAELTDGAVAGLAGSTELTLQAARQGFRLTHDRSWHVAAETREALTLRRVSETGLLAQTTLRRRPPKSAGRRPTLESFEEEVRFSLGGAFTRLVSSEQWESQSGCPCLGLVVEGEADGVPLQWRYYLVMPSDAQGDGVKHTIALATTVEAALADRVGAADRQLADRLELVAPLKGAPGIAALEPAPTSTSKPTTRRRKAARIATKPKRTAARPSRRSSAPRRR